MTTTRYSDPDRMRWGGDWAGSFGFELTIPIEIRSMGWLRGLWIDVTGSRPPTYRRPLAAAERTRSRRRLAGARRTRRYGLAPAGPSGRAVDWPFNAVRTVRA